MSSQGTLKKDLFLSIKDKNGQRPDIMLFGASAGKAKEQVLDHMSQEVFLKQSKGLGLSFSRITNPVLSDTPDRLPENTYKESGYKLTNSLGGKLWSFDVRDDYIDVHSADGLDLDYLAFSELQTVKRTEFLYLLSKIKKTTDFKPFTVATVTAKAESWVRDWVEPFLDQNGNIDPEQEGKVKYFVIDRNTPVFADDEETLVKEYPELCWITHPILRKQVYVAPRTITYVSSLLTDNPFLTELCPSYIKYIKDSPTETINKLLLGCWN